MKNSPDPSTTPAWRRLFSEEYYLDRHRDVAASGMEALEHYEAHGMRERRSPHPFFDPKWYLSTYFGEAPAPDNLVHHYFEEGARQGFDPDPRFDTQWYWRQYPGLAESGENPILHFLAIEGINVDALAASIVEKIRQIKADETLWAPDTVPTAEAGIVISACSRFFRPLHANLQNIRRLGCHLPIDIWHLPGEFSPGRVACLQQFATLVDAGITPFAGLSGQHEVHGFKAWMLSQSRFAKTLLLDVNSFPLRDVTAIFEDFGRCLLWRDGPWGCCLETTHRLRRLLGLPGHAHEFESGQIFVDRSDPDVNRALRLAAGLNTLGRRLYAYTYGDKETYALAFDLLQLPFEIAPEPSVFRSAATTVENSGLLQPWTDGTPLFYHPLGDREQWWHYQPGWALLEEEARAAEQTCL